MTAGRWPEILDRMRAFQDALRSDEESDSDLLELAIIIRTTAPENDRGVDRIIGQLVYEGADLHDAALAARDACKIHPNKYP